VPESIPMTTSPLAARSERFLYEFDAFKVDPVRRRLLRDGNVVSLTPKAFSILLVLIENHGEVVEKEELIRGVWGDAYVTEANLTQNVSSLRKALGEKANDHRFVVTVPGRGYSFVAEVAEVPREPTGEFPVLTLPTPSPPAPSLDESGVFQMPTPSPDESGVFRRPAPAPDESGVFQMPPPVAAAPAAPGAPPRLKGRRRFLLAGLVLGFLLAVAVAGLYLTYKERSSRAVPAEPPAGKEAVRPSGFRPTVAVLGFRNLSGDRRKDWLATALAEMLTTELSAGSKVRMVSGEEIARVKDDLSLPAAEELSPENLRQIREVLGAELVVVGSYLSLGREGGSRIRIDLRVVKTPEGETVASLAEVGTEGGLFDLVAVVGGRLRRSLGWSTPSPEEARAVQALQPGSPEAARLYAEGLVRLRAFDSQGARDLLRKAAEADPESAVIRSALSLAWAGLGHDAQALEEAQRAVELAAALPKEERLAIEARFDEAKKDWDKASEIYRSLWTFYPDDLEYGLRLANSLSIAGRNAEAVATVATLRKLPLPLRDDPRIDLVAARSSSSGPPSRRETSAATTAAEKGRKLGQTQILGEALLLRGDALYTVGRPEESLAALHKAQSLFGEASNQAAQARTLNRIGAVLLDMGNLAEAERNYQEALAIARRIGSDDLIATQTLALGFVAGNLGDLERSRALATEAHARFVELGEQLYRTRSLFQVADVLWEMGDPEGARRRFEEVLTLAHKSGNRVEEARALNGISESLLAAGLLKEARQRQEQALAISRSSGDPFLTAEYLASVGRTLMLQGDLSKARSHLDSALKDKQRIRDRFGATQVLGGLSDLAYAQGDLSLARRYASEQRALADQIQAGLASVAALARQGRLDLAAGELPAAREHLSEALRLSSSRGAALLAAEIRLDLARLAWLDRQPAEAERLAREAADWYAARRMTDPQARALALRSQALMALGRSREAQAVADQAHSISGESENVALQIEVVTAIAPAGVATGAHRAALGHLRWAVEETSRIGAVAAGLEARLNLGALYLQRGDAPGRTLLDEVRRDAETQGFKGIARRAAAALQGGQPVPLG
jgi:DNA-binding winged helix-turn-helix (wHTH) protein/tetratricopeptide (TPR) repeat protein/TolB-like protein